MLPDFMTCALLSSGLFMLAAFGAALVLYDEKKKLEKLRADDKESFVAYAAKQREAIDARDAMLAHWCNESIQLQRQLQSAWTEKRRW